MCQTMGSKALDLPESSVQTLFLRLLWGSYCRGSILSDDEVHSALFVTESGLKILVSLSSSLELVS